jgi:hypothetical protein
MKPHEPEVNRSSERRPCGSSNNSPPQVPTGRSPVTFDGFRADTVIRSDAAVPHRSRSPHLLTRFLNLVEEQAAGETRSDPLDPPAAGGSVT